MRPQLLLALVALAGAPLPAAMPPAVGETPLPTLAPMIKKVSPAVVNIATRGTIRERGPQNPLLDDPFFRRFFDVPPDTGPRERPFQSAGSGVIVDAKSGYIVTNAHVVENASEITVTLQDGRDLKADVVGSDTPSDVAVLKVDRKSTRLNSSHSQISYAAFCLKKKQRAAAVGADGTEPPRPPHGSADRDRPDHVAGHHPAGAPASHRSSRRPIHALSALRKKRA